MECSEESMDQTVVVVCPRCGSRHCQLQAIARKAGIVVGGVLGTIVGAGLSGAKVGSAIGAAIANVVSRGSSSVITGTISGAIVGFAWGAIAGHAVGADIDTNVLRMHRCCECGFEFKA